MEGDASLDDARASRQEERRSYFTRSKLATDTWKAAGVLPFSYHDGGCWILLGGEQVRTGPKGKFRQLMWRDFGGQREAIDEDAAATASRECSEETLGMLYGCSSADAYAVRRSAETLADRLRASTHSMCAVHQLKKGAYHMYICQSSFVDPLMFALATEQNAARASPVPGAEKTLFAWVLLVDVLKAVTHARKSYFLRTHRRIASQGPGQRSIPRKLMLHPCFASSLRIAVASGLLPLVKACQAPGQSLPANTSGAGASRQQQGQPSWQSTAGAQEVTLPLDNDSNAAAAGTCVEYALQPGMTQRLADEEQAEQYAIADVRLPGPGPLPMHMWWTLLQHNVATRMEILVPPEAARYSQMVQGDDKTMQGDVAGPMETCG